MRIFNQDKGDLPLLVSVGWGIGTMVPAIMFNITTIFLMRFMTDSLGIAAAVAGGIFALSKLYDAVTDPLMGFISDLGKNLFSRRRVYLIIGSLISGISLIIIFNFPLNLGANSVVWYMFFCLVVYSTGYTVFNVPYLAMPAEMTQNYHERSFLTSWRVVSINFAQLLALVAVPIVLANADSTRLGYSWVGWITGASVMLFGLISFMLTARAPQYRVVARDKPATVDQIRSALSNKPFFILVSAKFLILLANSFSFGAFAYFIQRVLERSDQIISLMFFITTVASFFAIPVWLVIGKKIGKSRTLIIACSILAFTSLSWLLAGQGESIILISLRAVGSGIAAAGILIMGQSMLPDTIEYDRRRTGLERSGIFSGIYTTAEKLAYALGPALTGFFLGSMGYVSSTDGSVIQQPESAITAIYICIGFAPVLSLLAGCFCIAYYSLDELSLKSAGDKTQQS